MGPERTELDQMWLTSLTASGTGHFLLKDRLTLHFCPPSLLHSLFVFSNPLLVHAWFFSFSCDFSSYFPSWFFSFCSITFKTSRTFWFWLLHEWVSVTMTDTNAWTAKGSLSLAHSSRDLSLNHVAPLAWASGKDSGPEGTYLREGRLREGKRDLIVTFKMTTSPGWPKDWPLGSSSSSPPPHALWWQSLTQELWGHPTSKP